MSSLSQNVSCLSCLLSYIIPLFELFVNCLSSIVLFVVCLPIVFSISELFANCLVAIYNWQVLCQSFVNCLSSTVEFLVFCLVLFFIALAVLLAYLTYFPNQHIFN